MNRTLELCIGCWQNNSNAHLMSGKQFALFNLWRSFLSLFLPLFCPFCSIISRSMGGYANGLPSTSCSSLALLSDESSSSLSLDENQSGCSDNLFAFLFCCGAKFSVGRTIEFYEYKQWQQQQHHHHYQDKKKHYKKYPNSLQIQ